MRRDLDAGQELGPHQEPNMYGDVQSTSQEKAGDDPCIHHRIPWQLPGTTVRKSYSTNVNN
jgi:hypothetical protein